MAPPQDIDHVLHDWPYRPEAVSVRLIRAEDGRDVIQMRIDMGLLQLETTGRPDGDRPGGADTFYDHLRGEAPAGGEAFVMSEEQCQEADREFVQFYHRRICWLALREFQQAVRDAQHTLDFMDFCKAHSPDEQWTLSHEQYRPFVMFHKIQAAAFAELDASDAEGAMNAINAGLDELRNLFIEHDAEEHFEEDELVQRLIELRESLREQFDVGRTLSERLADAIAAEKYELAAQLRDELSKSDGGKR